MTKQIFFLLSLFLFCNSTGVFPVNFASNNYFYSLLAYCPAKSYVINWNCGPICSETDTLTTILSFHGIDSSYFTLGYEINTKTVYVSFRSSEFNDIGREIWQLQQDNGTVFPLCQNCIVLSKPYQQFQSLKTYFYGAINYYEQFIDFQKIVLVGYGLGGTLAQFFALDLINNPIFTTLKQKKVSINLFTYASPAIGNLEFVIFAEQKLENISPKYRITFHKDPSPNFPRGFSQLVSEIFYYPPDNLYRICNDFIGGVSLDCSIQYIYNNDIDMEDLFKYYQKDSRSLVLACSS